MSSEIENRTNESQESYNKFFEKFPEMDEKNPDMFYVFGVVKIGEDNNNEAHSSIKFFLIALAALAIMFILSNLPIIIGFFMSAIAGNFFWIIAVVGIVMAFEWILF